MTTSLLAATTLEKIQAVPPRIWLNVAIAIAIFFASVIVIRKLAGVNKITLSIIFLVISSIVGFSWIYSRNEPQFLTPVIDKIAPFFPSEAKRIEKQNRDPVR